MRPGDSKARWIEKVLRIGYPLLVLSIFLWLVATTPVRAGSIRKLSLSTEHPGSVTLASGHTTALSFSMKPDRVVVGAPEKLHVDFLGNDVIVSPVGRDPGNLLIYTKAGRYVIHFQLGGANQYDDVVEITETGAASSTRRLRLLQDSYGIEQFELKIQSSKREEAKSRITAWISRDRRVLSGEELTEFRQKHPRLRCNGCLGKSRNESGFSLVCTEPIQALRCQGDGQEKIQITRMAHADPRGAP